MPESAPRSPLSLELVLAIGVPVIAVIAGVFMIALSLSQGFTPVPSAAPAALHGS